MSRKHLFTGSIAVLVIVFVAGLFAYRGLQGKEAVQVAAQNRAYLVRVHSPGLGESTAKVHIVEFMDPACSTCRSFAPLVKQMLKTHPGQIRLSVRHIPLHPGSEEVVKALEASRAQGKYWETLDALLASQPRWVIDHHAYADRIWSELGGVGLDLDRLRTDMQSPEVAQRMAQDMSDARALKVVATPEFFVNGRPLPDFGYEQLNSLVQTALAEAY